MCRWLCKVSPFTGEGFGWPENKQRKLATGLLKHHAEGYSYHKRSRERSSLPETNKCIKLFTASCNVSVYPCWVVECLNKCLFVKYPKVQNRISHDRIRRFPSAILLNSSDGEDEAQGKEGNTVYYLGKGIFCVSLSVK